MALIRLILATLALLAAAHAQTLTGCDDCCTSPIGLRYGSIYMGGSQYGAFSVCSNGYILLLSSTSSTPRGYSYNPTSISQTEGSPMIAGFWSDVNLRCSGTTNTVRYEESCANSLLWTIRSAVPDSSFNPSSVLVVEYDAVQRYTCPSSCETNTFTITVATDRSACRSYVILDYQSMGWNRATPYYNAPVVGYSNGQCQGFQASLGSDAAAYLNQCRRLVYRIDQTFSQEVQAQMNRGNLVLMQQQDKGGASMQQGGAKGANAGAMYNFPRQDVMMQEFAEKNNAAMQDKLSLALQEVNAQQAGVIVQNFAEKN